jgi:RIO-like serine/threonine protein kinase
MFDSLKLCDLPERQCGVLRKPSNTRPLLRVIEENGKRAVVKDFSVNGFIYRNVAGRFLVWREKKAYEKLEGIKGIPVFYGSVDGLAIIIEEITGKSMKAVHKTTGIPEKFYSDLHDLLKAIHSAGLAHCDLKRAPNIIMGDDGMPYLVDWSASISAGEFGIFPLSMIFKRFVRDDFNSIIKLKLKYNPEIVSREEKDRYMNRGFFERVVRHIRDNARRLLKKIA